MICVFFIVITWLNKAISYIYIYIYIFIIKDFVQVYRYEKNTEIKYKKASVLSTKWTLDPIDIIDSHLDLKIALKATRNDLL